MFAQKSGAAAAAAAAAAGAAAAAAAIVVAVAAAAAAVSVQQPIGCSTRCATRLIPKTAVDRWVRARRREPVSDGEPRAEEEVMAANLAN